MTVIGTFYGVGVGPGPEGLIPIAAVKALQEADVILAPKAKHVEKSIARQCIRGLDLAEDKVQDLIYNMESERDETRAHYRSIAENIAAELRNGKTIAYLTIGDALTYSTYSYTLSALLEIMPDVPHKTFPGVTSFAAIAAALDWPIGQGKERVLILPCPDSADELRREIESHEIVVLMKIGERLSMVLSLIEELGIASQCGFGNRIGLPGELVSTDLAELGNKKNAGYLTTMLIRNKPHVQEPASK